MMTTSRDSDRFIVRLPDGMRDRIKAAAEANNRSMNAEIVSTLAEAYPEPNPALAVTNRLLPLAIKVVDRQRTGNRNAAQDAATATIVAMALMRRIDFARIADLTDNRIMAMMDDLFSDQKFLGWIKTMQETGKVRFDM